MNHLVSKPWFIGISETDCDANSFGHEAALLVEDLRFVEC
jgi:hypothetical protein